MCEDSLGTDPVLKISKEGRERGWEERRKGGRKKKKKGRNYF